MMREKCNIDCDLVENLGKFAGSYQCTARDWPCEQSQLEAAMLGGRPNNVL